MTEKEVVEILKLFKRAPDDIREASEKLKYWQNVGGPVAEEEEVRLEKKIIELQTFIAAVGRALERLPKYQRDIVRFRGDSVVWWKISREVGYSVRSCQGHYSHALRSLADSKELLKYAGTKEGFDS